MAAKPLTSEAIALTEKKMDMTLEDIIKMSKKPSPSKTVKNQRVPNKNQKPLNGVPAKGNTMKVRQYMDSRSSIRQGALAQRRSSFQGNQFPLANEAARRAAVAPLRSWPVNRTGMNNWNKQRIGVPPVQRRAEVGFAVKARQPVKVNKRPGTLDTLFANMKEQRMRGQTQQNGNNMKEQRRRAQGQQNGNNIRRGAGVQQRRYGRARFANYAN